MLTLTSRVPARNAEPRTITCRPLTVAGPCTWPAIVRDVSVHSVTVQLHRRFERGTILSLTVADAQGDDLSFVAVVEQVQQREAVNWLLRCRFIGKVSVEELAALA